MVSCPKSEHETCYGDGKASEAEPYYGRDNLPVRYHRQAAQKQKDPPEANHNNCGFGSPISFLYQSIFILGDNSPDRKDQHPHEPDYATNIHFHERILSRDTAGLLILEGCSRTAFGENG
jgi:hypothetical protein